MHEAASQAVSLVHAVVLAGHRVTGHQRMIDRLSVVAVVGGAGLPTMHENRKAVDVEGHPARGVVASGGSQMRPASGHVEVMEFRDLDDGVQHGGGAAAREAAEEQEVLSSQNGPAQRALRQARIEFDPTVVEEPQQFVATVAGTEAGRLRLRSAAGELATAGVLYIRRPAIQRAAFSGQPGLGSAARFPLRVAVRGAG